MKNTDPDKIKSPFRMFIRKFEKMPFRYRSLTRIIEAIPLRYFRSDRKINIEIYFVYRSLTRIFAP